MYRSPLAQGEVVGTLGEFESSRTSLLPLFKVGLTMVSLQQPTRVCAVTEAEP